MKTPNQALATKNAIAAREDYSGAELKFGADPSNPQLRKAFFDSRDRLAEAEAIERATVQAIAAAEKAEADAARKAKNARLDVLCRTLTAEGFKQAAAPLLAKFIKLHEQATVIQAEAERLCEAHKADAREASQLFNELGLDPAARHIAAPYGSVMARDSADLAQASREAIWKRYPTPHPLLISRWFAVGAL